MPVNAVRYRTANATPEHAVSDLGNNVEWPAFPHALRAHRFTMRCFRAAAHRLPYATVGYRFFTGVQPPVCLLAAPQVATAPPLTRCACLSVHYGTTTHALRLFQVHTCWQEHAAVTERGSHHAHYLARRPYYCGFCAVCARSGENSLRGGATVSRVTCGVCSVPAPACK